jgi:hypothetical protein
MELRDWLTGYEQQPTSSGEVCALELSVLQLLVLLPEN